MALADQTYFNGDVVKMVGLHRPNTVLEGIGRGGHDEKWGENVREEEEMVYRPCPLWSGYKRVEDPLWPPDGLKGPKGSRDYTSKP